MKVAIYARVSTKSKQESKNQLIQLRAYCKKKNWNIYKEYIDKESGSTGNRTNFKKLFKEARQRKFDLVLFWALDRFSREGVRETINYLDLFEKYGIDFVSYTEQFLDSTGMFKDAIISILATLAKQERIKISERTKAGLERAKKEGKSLGRPTIPQEKVKKIKSLRKEGYSYREIGERVNVSKGTARKYC
jgi:DNA invertase Pin-like site-specific DNA recombinase